MTLGVRLVLTEISQKLYHQVKRAGIGQIGTTCTNVTLYP